MLLFDKLNDLWGSKWFYRSCITSYCSIIAKIQIKGQTAKKRGMTYLTFQHCCISSKNDEFLELLSWCPTNNFNTLRPRQNGRHFADDTFKHIFLNENVRISIKFSLKFVPEGPIDNIPALVQIMAWRRPGDKSLSEPMMVRLPTHICVTRPQWVKSNQCNWYQILSTCHYNNVIMSAMASQITGISIVCLTVCSGAHQGKYQSSASLVFIREIQRWPVDSPHKGQ